MTKTGDEIVEVDEFLRKTPIFPCFLISKDEGRIEPIFDGFEKKNFSIIKIQENSFTTTFHESKEDVHLLVDKKFSEDISLYGNSLNFDSKINTDDESSSSNKLFIGQYKLYSFNIREEDLSFSEYYLNKLQHIASNTSSDEEKAKELEEIFESTGYFIPKKIYIGGMMINRSNQISKNKTIKCIKDLDLKVDDIIQLDKSNFSANDKSKFNEVFNSQSTQIIGGDNQAKTFEDWIKSITLENANIVECCNIIPAKNIIDEDLKKQLEIPLKIIDEKYTRKKKFIEYFNQILNVKKVEKLNEKKGYGNFKRGICQEKNIVNEPRIYMEKFIIDTHVSYFPPIFVENFYQKFDDIIVGFEIIDDRKDGHNGDWTIGNEPLDNKEIKIKFASGLFRGQDFTIKIYLMQKPK